ncbi:MAG: hypothetical protein HKN25_09530 [Pyrinomonadaceae bacterium]|nr:hypothetical protein [Pyrinomonadaceae bacterium]
MRNFKKHRFPVFAILFFSVIGCNLFNSEGVGIGSDKAGNGQKTEQETASEENADGAGHSEEVAPEEIVADKESTPARSSGSNTTVVKFKKGSTSGSYKNSVVRAESHTYVLGAAKGQKMAVKLNALEDNAVFYIKTPSGGFLDGATKNEPTDNFSGPLPANGKYRIVVSPTRGNATYNINFNVSGTSAAPKDKDNSSTVESVGGLTTTVRFKKGATSATYKNAVIRAQQNRYILGASGGQLMSVSISSLENNAVFDVQSPGGKVLAREKRRWSGRLPADGKYRIIVSGTRGNATYTVRFGVR